MGGSEGSGGWLGGFSSGARGLDRLGRYLQGLGTEGCGDGPGSHTGGFWVGGAER